MKFSEIQTTSRVNVGYPPAWVLAQRREWADAVEGLTEPIELNQTVIDDINDCGVMWHSKHTGERVPASAFRVQRDFYNDLVMGWLDHHLSHEPQVPADYFDWFIEQMPFFDAMTQAWLTLIPGERLTQIREMFVGWTRNICDSLQGLGGPLPIVLGPVVSEVQVGPAMIVVDRMMLTLGEATPGVDVTWPGATLIGLCLSDPTALDLDSMELPAAIHAMETGVPPRRVGVWGLGSGKSIVQDVDQAWIENAIAGVTVALGRITEIRVEKKFLVSGGPHCQWCPVANDCEFNEADDHDAF